MVITLDQNIEYAISLQPGTYTVSVMSLGHPVTGGATRTVVISDGVVLPVLFFPIVW